MAAMKSMIFLLALMFLVTRLASSVEDIDSVLAQHILHVKSQAKGPVYGPSMARMPSPTKGGNCVEMCAEYCKPTTPKRPCMKTCAACCAKNKCVPKLMKCHDWDKVMFQGKMVNCP
ncbi:hypothetical protein ACJIZ3_007949 [Penstemon smallii]|uniref:Uncharacterized protein n=1 Tax=Penstemon smallii TaxID=265156 RepID=A0ABD3T9E5_9LAMI